MNDVEWNKSFMKEYLKMELEAIKSEVVNLLVTDHEFTLDEADEMVANSLAAHPAHWSENADPKDLANFLASDENDD